MSAAAIHSTGTASKLQRPPTAGGLGKGCREGAVHTEYPWRFLTFSTEGASTQDGKPGEMGTGPQVSVGQVGVTKKPLCHPSGLVLRWEPPMWPHHPIQVQVCNALGPSGTALARSELLI